MALCEHEQRAPHGEPGKDWCPGFLPRMSEPWREQLKFQMNSTPIWDGPGAMTRDALRRSDYINLPWRVGSKVKRTIYAVVPDLGHDQHPLLGLMDTPQLAEEVVFAHNRLLEAIKNMQR